MCDTAAMVCTCRLLEETGHLPSMKYVYGAEIFEHAQRIATTFDLYDNALFSTQVTHLEWNQIDQRWVIETDRGDRFRAQFVAMGTGPMTRPKLPGIAGIDDFGGDVFHTARWDYGYTGGDRAGAPMGNLADKRVGIIGTGATAVQCIPPLARDAAELFVFQRTPSSHRRAEQSSLGPRRRRRTRSRMAAEVGGTTSQLFRWRATLTRTS